MSASDLEIICVYAARGLQSKFSKHSMMSGSLIISLFRVYLRETVELYSISLFPSLRSWRLQSSNFMQFSASSELIIRIGGRSNNFSILSRFTLNSRFIQCYLCLDREEAVDYSLQFVVSNFFVSDFLVCHVSSQNDRPPRTFVFLIALQTKTKIALDKSTRN